MLTSNLRINHLKTLRTQLVRLRHRRRWFRWATAASALAIAALWALAVIFALDWFFQRNIDVFQRLLLAGLAAVGVSWAFARFVRPWLGQREDDTDMALLVQRRAGIDSDLVAALQFESDSAAGWGSRQLETAVIDRVAAEQKNLDVMIAMPRDPLARRLKLLLVTAAVWIVVGLAAPAYVRVFFERLGFGPQHYPSQTSVVAISVNGKEVELAASHRATLLVACDRPVHFDVTTAGTQPDTGRVEITGQGGGPAATVPLELQPGGGSAQPPGLYRGEYPKISQPASFVVFVGDAWTDPVYLSVTPLPAVEIEVEVVQPEYVRRSADAVLKLPRGMRDFSVLAGSEVRLKLECDRPIDSAEVKVAGKSYAMKRSPSPEPGRRAGTESWTLPTSGTPLAAIAAETSYAIQIHDPEGQTLEQPLEGAIGIEPDLPPAIAAKTRSQVVLPTATPSVHYEAADDHALSHIWLTWEATSGEGESLAAGHERTQAGSGRRTGDSAQTAPKREGSIEICRFSPEKAPRNQEADFPLALQSLPLKPGDTLKVTFHASDYRGPAAAATVDADPPLVFQVTDLQGFEASMYEADQKSAGALEDIRKKHSGLGDDQ